MQAEQGRVAPAGDVAKGLHDPDIADVVVVLVRVPCRGEGNPRPRGGPDWIRIDTVSVRDLPGLAPGDGDDEQVRSPVVDKAFAIEFVFQCRDDSGRSRLLLLVLALGPCQPPTQETNTRCVPSGDQAGAKTQFLKSVIRIASPSSAGMT